MLCRFATLAAVICGALLPLTAAQVVPQGTYRTIQARGLRQSSDPSGSQPNPKVSDTAIAKVASHTTAVSGQVTFYQADPRAPVQIKYSLTGLKPNQIYHYHVHEGPVGENLDCSAAGGHYDPTKVNKGAATYKCNPNDAFATCELGDLSGRFGPIVATGTGLAQSAQTYRDVYLGIRNGNIISNRAVVVHNEKGDRVACGNILVQATY